MPGKATKTVELRINTRNELGAAAKLTMPLRQNRVNIDCFCGYEQGEEATFYLVTSDNPKAKNLLTSAGYTVTENPVVLWTVDNTPGEFNRATTALAETKINVSYAYSTSIPNGTTASVIFATNDNNKAYDTLSKL